MPAVGRDRAVLLYLWYRAAPRAGAISGLLLGPEVGENQEATGI